MKLEIYTALLQIQFQRLATTGDAMPVSGGTRKHKSFVPPNDNKFMNICTAVRFQRKIKTNKRPEMVSHQKNTKKKSEQAKLNR